MPHFARPDPDPVLRLLRRVMPGVGGVVLADSDGRPLAHDLPTDPGPVADRARRQRAAHATPCAGTLVPMGASLCLVVFLPPEAAAPWAEGFSTPRGLPASCPAPPERSSPAATP